MEVSVEHCKMMPNMAGCEAFKDVPTDNYTINETHQMNHADMVRSEFDFIYLMIPHHQEAVDTSLPINRTTTNPELKTLTDAIVTSQTAEIAMMKKRLTEFYPDTTYEGMEYMPMMRDVSQINDISTKEKMRTQDMIVHHQGAVDMATKLLEIMDKNDPLIKVDEKTRMFRAALRKFAQDVITNQSKEIQAMQEMLSA